MRPVNQIIEFKQIVGRGTRLFDGKEFFTIYDFVDANQRFLDPEWDGEPEYEIENDSVKDKNTIKEDSDSYNEKEKESKNKIKIKLRDGKEREIQHMISTSFWSVDGKPISAEDFLQNLFGKLPDLFKDENELKRIWSKPETRKALLDKLEEVGYGRDDLKALQKMINAENGDLFDVLEYIAFAVKPITRKDRVDRIREDKIFFMLNKEQKDFIRFVLSKYIEDGVDELSQEKLPELLKIKYNELTDAAALLGGVDNIVKTFINFQKHLYMQDSA
jgi:type I restriction enzyme, R subunit